MSRRDVHQALRAMLLAVALAFRPGVCLAGPPFETDDPEPNEPGASEVNIGAQGSHGDGRLTTTAPQVDLNRGLPHDLQLHALVQMVYDHQRSGGSRYGYGSTELALKWRMLRASDVHLELAFEPTVELPVGSKAVGDRHLQTFLPCWVGWTRERWFTYGGGGPWLNPGRGYRDGWYAGWVVQYQAATHCMVGGEFNHATAMTAGARDRSVCNAGGILDLTNHVHLMASGGRQVQGPAETTWYGAIRLAY